MRTIARFRGALLGLAVGDALGTTVEFCAPGTFPPLTDIVGGGPFHLKPGQWTDDTSMALCLAESLIECRGFDPADQMRRYLRWWREGTLSATGYCFDIGRTTSRALATFERTGNPYSGKAKWVSTPQDSTTLHSAFQGLRVAIFALCSFSTELHPTTQHSILFVVVLL